MSTFYNPLPLFVLVSEAAAGSLSRYAYPLLVLFSTPAPPNWQFSFVSIFADIVFAALVAFLSPALEKSNLACVGIVIAVGAIFSNKSSVSLFSSKFARKWKHYSLDCKRRMGMKIAVKTLTNPRAVEPTFLTGHKLRERHHLVRPEKTHYKRRCRGLTREASSPVESLWSMKSSFVRLSLSALLSSPIQSSSPSAYILQLENTLLLIVSLLTHCVKSLDKMPPATVPDSGTVGTNHPPTVSVTTRAIMPRS